MKILLTGFDPFRNSRINPSIEVVKRIPDRIDGVEIKKLELPTEFKRSKEILFKAIEEEQPDYVISIGQAGGRDGITPELISINLDDATIGDNVNDRPLNVSIYPDGENAYFSNVPNRTIVEAIKRKGIPSHVSTTAGTFVCNHVMYLTQYLIANRYPSMKAGFIHIPFLPEQVRGKKLPSLTLDQDVKGIQTALEVVIQSANNY